MAASTIYAAQSLILDGSPAVDVPFVAGQLDVEGGLNVEYLQSGNVLTPDIASVVGKRPSLRFTTLDPSLVTTLAAVGSGETITAVKGNFRAYEQNGTLSTTYKSFAGAQGLLLPVSLSFSATTRATLDAVFLAAFDSGAAFTVGTATDAAATVAKAYYPTSLVIGGDTITDLQSGSVNWNYQQADDNSEEPAYYVVTSAARTATAVSQDLSNVSAARLEDGTTENVVLTLTNRQSGGGTVEIDLGDCFVQATVTGNQVTYQINELTA